MNRISEIKVYIFKEDDGLNRAERLLRAAEHCFRSEAEGALASGASDGEMSDLHVEKELLLVEKTPLGKPFFPKFPKLHLSISHSGAYWVCAFAPEEVGVDIQEHVMNRNETRQEATARFCKMAHRFFHPVEAQFVECESFYRFFGIWAARESYVKYTGQGIDASFSEHCVIPQMCQHWPELTPKVPVQEVRWQAQGAWFWETVWEENYTLCVCTAKEMHCRVITSLEKHFL